VVKQDPKPKYRLTIAQFDDGNNSVHGADIRVFKNSQEVSLDEPFEEGTRLRVELKERDDYIFEGWVGDLPNDAAGQLNKAHTFVVNMDRDRDLLAYFSTPAPDDPRDFLDEFTLVIQGEEVNENGEKIGDTVPYIIVFSVDQDGVKEDGTSGSIQVIAQVNEDGTINEDLDFDSDGNSDLITGRFIFEQTDEGEGSFRIVDMGVTLASGSPWDGGEPWGGSMEMSIIFQKQQDGREAGSFVMFKDDATENQGAWNSENVRKDFSL
jgi:hypothetical protein